MIKFLSQLVGAQVLLFQERVIVGTIERVLVDPDDGSLAGFAVNPTHQKGLTYIPTSEVKGFGQGFMMVEGLNSLSEDTDVVKIRRVLEREPVIISARVLTESGQRLGRVEDATLDLGLGVLKSIYVTPGLPLNILGEQKIISRRQIVRIEPRKIIVRDAKERKTSPALGTAEALATD